MSTLTEKRTLPKTVTVRIESFDKTIQRSRERAKKIDRGEVVEASRTLVVEDADLFFRIFTRKRVELIQIARTGAFSVTELAARLHREPSAVRRDVAALKRAGLVLTVRERNPGHGQVTIVKSVESIRIEATF